MRKLISLFKTKKKSEKMETKEKNLEDLKLKYQGIREMELRKVEIYLMSQRIQMVIISLLLIQLLKGCA